MIELILTVAIVIAGECGPISGGCEIEMARTMANRLESPDFPSTIEEVLEAYYGRGDVTAASLGAAMRLLSRPESLTDGKYYFAYSNSDRVNMGWREGDEVICGASLCVNFSERWPGCGR